MQDISERTVPRPRRRRRSLHCGDHEVLTSRSSLPTTTCFASDAALLEAVAREVRRWAAADLTRFGERLGTADYLELGVLATATSRNSTPRPLRPARRSGAPSIPAYHALMRTAIEEGLHASPWTDPRPGAHVARAAPPICIPRSRRPRLPITMTFAASAVPAAAADLAAAWLRSCMPASTTRATCGGAEAGITIGMAMTEKQGGSGRARQHHARDSGRRRGAGPRL